jgi:hypothetical protein
MKAHHGEFVMLLGLMHVLVVAAAYVLLDARAAACTAATLAVNLTYSLWLKGVVFVDVLWVALWGFTYVAIAGPWQPALVFGAGTAISHFYQAWLDRDADLTVGVRTSASVPPLAVALLAAACAALVIGLWSQLGMTLALAGLAPLPFGLLLQRTHLAWLLSKACFGVLWLALLWQIHAAG